MINYRGHGYSQTDAYGDSFDFSVVSEFRDHNGDRDFRNRPALEVTVTSTDGVLVDLTHDTLDRMIDALTRAKALVGACADTARGIPGADRPCHLPHGHDGDHDGVNGGRWPNTTA